jgi:hypothetical protein
VRRARKCVHAVVRVCSGECTQCVSRGLVSLIVDTGLGIHARQVDGLRAQAIGWHARRRLPRQVEPHARERIEWRAGARMRFVVLDETHARRHVAQRLHKRKPVALELRARARVGGEPGWVVVAARSLDALVGERGQVHAHCRPRVGRRPYAKEVDAVSQCERRVQGGEARVDVLRKLGV